MPRPRSGPHYYRRPGRRIFYAFIDRETRHISLGTDDEEQAAINLADLIHRRAAQGSAPRKGELGQVIIECVKRAQVNHTVKYAYDLNLKLAHLALWLEANNALRPDTVTLGLVEKFKADERARGLVDRSINRYLDAWKKVMRHAVDDGLAPPRVLTYFRKLREPQPEAHQRGLTMDEINAVLCAATDERDYYHWRTIAGSGIRDDEARHLEPECVREDSIVITPLPAGLCRCHQRGWTTKNFRYRSIPATPETVAAARSYVAIKHSMVLDAKSVWRRLQAARRAAHIEWEWSMHDLRRAWGSHLLAAGLKLADISRWYGHRDIRTTMRYLRVVEDEMPARERLPL